jgi:hypothetical protein
MTTTPEQRIAAEYRGLKTRWDFRNSGLPELRMYLCRKHEIPVSRLREIIRDNPKKPSEAKQCSHCGMKIVSEQEFEENPDGTCTGEVTFDTDPFLVQIHDDYTKSWNCPHNRAVRELDV